MSRSFEMPLLGGGSFTHTVGADTSASSGGTTLFDLSIVIGVDAQNAKKTIDDLSGTMALAAKQFSDDAGEMEGAGTSLFSAFTSGLSGLYSAFENFLLWLGNFDLWGIGTELIEVADEVEKERRLFATAFRGVEEEATSAMETMADESGIHFGRLRGNFARMQTQFIGVGFSADEALAMTTRGMQLAADASAVYGVSMDEATERVMSFARGNSEAGESIGLFSSATERNAYATQLYGKAWKDLTEMERQYALMQMGYDAYQKGGFLGKAAEYSDTYSNSLANLKSAWREVQAALGTPIMKAVAPVLQQFTDWLSDNPEKVQALADSIGHLVAAMVELLKTFLNFIEANPEFVDNLIATFNSLLGFLGIIEPEVQFAPKGGADDVTDFVGLTRAEGAERWQYGYDWIQAFEDLKREENDAEWFDFMDVWGAEGRLNTARATAQQYMTPEEYKAVEDYLAERTINPQTGRAYKYREGVYLEGAESFLDETFGDLSALPEEVKEGAKEGAKQGVAEGLAGLSITMDKVAIGQMVAPTVMGVMARSVRNSRFTGGSNA